MALQTSDQTRKELDKYTRNFVMKSLQVIVQSRMGEKCKYTAKENSCLDWEKLSQSSSSPPSSSNSKTSESEVQEKLSQSSSSPPSSSNSKTSESEVQEKLSQSSSSPPSSSNSKTSESESEVQEKLSQSSSSPSKSSNSKTSESEVQFNLPIPDIPELSAVARKTLGTGPVLSQPVNVEISLKTKENNAYIFLEVWSLSLDVENCDPDVKITSTVYSRMTLALKAILSVSRVAPAFRLAQRQKKDDFQIHYQSFKSRVMNWRYNVGPPNLGILREGIQTRRIAAVATPAGTIRVTLSYTTKPQMPQQNRQGLALKTDHFSAPNVCHVSEPKPCNRKFRNPTSVEDLRILESQEKQDTFSTTFSTSPPDGTACSVSPPPPLPQINEASGVLIDSTDGSKKESKSAEREVNPFDAYHQRSVFFHGEGKTVQIERPEDCPFASLMADLPKPSADDTLSDASDQEEKEDEKEEPTEAKEEREDSDEEGDEEEEKSQSPNDFVMLPPLVGMESPFRDSEPTADLGEFYRTMQLAEQAPLDLLEEQVVPVDELLANIKEQIDKYASMQPGFEQFIKTLNDKEEEHSD